MAFRRSMGLRNKLLTDGGFKSVMDSGHLRFYSGAQPATPESVETGVMLCEIGTAGLAWGTAGSGVINKSAATWSGTCAVAGIAGWFRYYDTNYFTGSDGAGTAMRFDGAIGSVTGDIILTPTNLAVNAPVIVDSLQVSLDMNNS